MHNKLHQTGDVFFRLQLKEITLTLNLHGNSVWSMCASDMQERMFSFHKHTKIATLAGCVWEPFTDPQDLYLYLWCYSGEAAIPSCKGHFSLPQSVHKMWSRWVRKPRPTSDTEHCMQVKHSLCHWRSSKEMYLSPARPARITHPRIHDNS